MQLLYKYYSNIKFLDLSVVLSEVKHLIAELPSRGPELDYKLEFVCEELVSNSFKYSLVDATSVELTIKISDNPLQFVFEEHGVNDVDFEVFLAQGKCKQNQVGKLEVGGLGLYLIEQLVNKFSYKYDMSNKTRIFTLLLE